MKHFSLKLAAAILLLLCCVSVQAQDFEENGVYYNITGYNSCEVTNGGKTGQYSDTIVIPSKVSFAGTDYNVTGIGNEAFSGCTKLTSISIPNTIRYVGNSAFYGCSGMETISLPNSVKSIGEHAFQRCYFKNFDIPSSIVSIGRYAFMDNRLHEVYIPKNVIHIGRQAFNNAFTNIGTEKFSIDEDNPKYLTDGISLISRRANDSIVLEDGIMDFIMAIQSPYNIPNIVTHIGDSAFERARAVSVIIPNSVKSIGNGAFYYCSSLTSVSIPNSVKNIGISAFALCSKLTSINIPNSITAISYGLFSYCSSLTKLTIPNTITKISYSAFIGTGLKSLYIPHLITDFYISDCGNLSSITIGYSVKSINSFSFRDCPSLKRIVIQAPEPPYCKDTYIQQIIDNGATLYVPASAKEKYMAVSPWKDFKNIETAPETAFNISLSPAPGGKSYGTAYLPFSAQRPEDGTAKFYFASTPAEGSVKLNEVKDAWIPAKTGFVVIDETGADKATVIIRYTDPESTLPDNALQGCLNDSTIEDAASKVYVLGNSKGVEGFFRPNSNVMKANRAFLPSTAEFKTLSFSFDNNTTTGIEGVVTEPIDDDNAPVYDLSGRRVYGKLPKGIYIKQGRKFYVK